MNSFKYFINNDISLNKKTPSLMDASRVTKLTLDIDYFFEKYDQSI